MAAHNDLGHWGEQKAAEYLEHKGYGIMRRNWHYGKRDLDIVAFKDDTVVIVEVKTRRNNTFTEPEQAVDRQKIKSLSIAANAFVKAERIDADIRFDIISITGISDDDYNINHIEDAFMPLPY